MALRKKIFVSIVSYKDPLLEQTVNSLLDNISPNNDITISILDQSQNKFTIKNNNVIYVQVDPSISKGIGWARHVNSLNISDEDFYYQIDSHAIFDKHWDMYLVDDYNKYQNLYNTTKIILSSASKEFIMENDVPIKQDANENIAFITKFTIQPELSDTEKLLIVHSYARSPVSDDEELPAIHLHGGNLFTHAEFIHNVGISPTQFSHGEEQYLTLSAFINGYKLFHHSSVHNYHHDYDWKEAVTNPLNDISRSSEQLQKLQEKSKEAFTKFILSLTDKQILEYYQYSGVDYKNNIIDDKSLCFYDTQKYSLCTDEVVLPEFVIYNKTNISYLLMNTNDIISHVINQHGSFNDERYQTAYTLLSKMSSVVIYDIGAHIGTFSLPIAKKLPNSQIYSFEVQQPIYLQLSANILLNSAFNITPVHAAIGNLTAKIQIDQLDYITSANIGAYTLDKEIRKINPQGNNYITDNQYTVDQIKLDDLTLPLPSLIKISVCGTEINVLKGAARIIKESKPIIFIDCWHSDFFTTQRNELLDYIKSIGYSSKSTGFDYLILTPI